MGTLLIVTSKILIICAVYGFIRYAVYVIKPIYKNGRNKKQN